MIEIRPYSYADLQALCALLKQLWPDKEVSAESVQSILDQGMKSGTHVFLCAFQEDELIGFGSLALKRNLWNEGVLGFIDELVVDEKFRGIGIGTKLLKALEHEASKSGCKRVELDSAFHRKEAHRFYEKNGFESRAFLFSKILK